MGIMDLDFVGLSAEDTEVGKLNTEVSELVKIHTEDGARGIGGDHQILQIQWHLHPGLQTSASLQPLSPAPKFPYHNLKHELPPPPTSLIPRISCIEPRRPKITRVIPPNLGRHVYQSTPSITNPIIPRSFVALRPARPTQPESSLRNRSPSVLLAKRDLLNSSRQRN